MQLIAFLSVYICSMFLKERLLFSIGPFFFIQLASNSQKLVLILIRCLKLSTYDAKLTSLTVEMAVDKCVYI